MLKNERYNKLVAELSEKLNMLSVELNLKENDDKVIEVDTYKLVKYALLAKYAKTTKVIAFLDMNGFFEDARILLRTVYELVVIMLYCNINEEEYYTRFKRYKCMTIKKYIDSLNEEQLKQVKPLALENNKKETNEYKEKYIKNKKDEKYWNGKTFKETMELVYNHYKDYNIKDLYYNVYMLDCEGVHSDFNGIINNYLILSQGNVTINADIKKDLSNTDIIEQIERISLKLDYIKFGLY